MSQELHFVKPAVGPVAKLVLLSILSIILMTLDKRYAAVQQAKSYAAAVLYPLQQVARQPVEIVQYGLTIWGDKNKLLEENQRLQNENTRLTVQLQQQAPLLREVEQLRVLHNLAPHLPSGGTVAEIIAESRHQTGHFVINRGSKHGIQIGDPVSDGYGLLGQVHMVHGEAAEIAPVGNTPLVIPAMLQRSGIQTLVYGRDGQLDLRYFPVSAELQTGDLLITSGIDSIYPAGIPLAKVVQAERHSGTPYYRAVLEPAAKLNGVRHVVVIPQKNPVSVQETAHEAP